MSKNRKRVFHSSSSSGEEEIEKEKTDNNSNDEDIFSDSDHLSIQENENLDRITKKKRTNKMNKKPNDSKGFEALFGTDNLDEDDENRSDTNNGERSVNSGDENNDGYLVGMRQDSWDSEDEMEGFIEDEEREKKDYKKKYKSNDSQNLYKESEINNSMLSRASTDQRKTILSIFGNMDSDISGDEDFSERDEDYREDESDDNNEEDGKVSDSSEASSEEDSDELNEEDQIQKKLKKKTQKKKANVKLKLLKLYQNVIDPYELEERFLTIKDALIQQKDIPERFQLHRGTFRTVTKFKDLKFPSFDEKDYTEEEIIEEAQWISYQMFSNENFREYVNIIIPILYYLRVKKFDIPYIQRYKNGCYFGKLNDSDIWTIYNKSLMFDRFKTRKEILSLIYSKKYNSRSKNNLLGLGSPNEETFKTLRDYLKKCQTNEELDDMFICYKVNMNKMAISNMKTKFLRASLSKHYKLIHQFGISASQFGENLEFNSQYNPVINPTEMPLNLAFKFIDKRFSTPSRVINAIRFVIEQQIVSEPTVRRAIRHIFLQFARVYVRPTEKGKNDIDYSHPYAGIKYIKAKPIHDFLNEQFLLISKAEKEGLVTVSFEIPIKNNDNTNYYDDYDKSNSLGNNIDQLNFTNKNNNHSTEQLKYGDNNNDKKTNKDDNNDDDWKLEDNWGTSTANQDGWGINKDDQKKDWNEDEKEINKNKNNNNDNDNNSNNNNNNNNDDMNLNNPNHSNIEKEFQAFYGNESNKENTTYKEEFLKLQQKRSKYKHNVLLTQLEKLYLNKEKTEISRQWNMIRSIILYNVLNKYLIPHFETEVRSKLIKEATELVAEKSSRRLLEMIQKGPFQPNMVDSQGIDLSTNIPKKGSSIVMSVSFISDMDPVMCVITDQDGNLGEFITLTELSFRKFDTVKREIPQNEVEDILKLDSFIRNELPDVIAIAANSFKSRRIYTYLLSLTQRMRNLKVPHITFVPTDVALLYMQSKTGNEEFPNLSRPMKHAISLGRRVQNPLMEITRLCSKNLNTLRALKLHPLQNQVPKKRLNRAFERAFVDVVNKVGVNFDEIYIHKHKSSILQFVSGLGPRKSQSIIQQFSSRNVSREEFLKSNIIDKCIETNCIGFLKFINSPNILDLTRIHPDKYLIAYKLLDEIVNDIGERFIKNNKLSKQQTVQKQIMELLSRSKLIENFDLKNFIQVIYKSKIFEESNKNFSSDALERCNSIDNYQQLINLILQEFFYPFRDTREDYRDPNEKELFYMITGETSDSMRVGQILQCQVMRFDKIRRRDHENENYSNGLGKNKVQKNLQEEEKDNYKVFVKILSNGLFTHIFSNHLLSYWKPNFELIDDNERMKIIDKKNKNNYRILTKGEIVKAKIISFNYQFFKINLTIREQEVSNEYLFTKKDDRIKNSSGDDQRKSNRRNNIILPYYDKYYDKDSEMKDYIDSIKPEIQKREYIRRMIKHPHFKNVSYEQTIEELNKREQGEFLFRPSSKGVDHLTLSWKFADGIILHYDILEKEKPNNFTIGRKLTLNNINYEDLDEINAGFIEPMSIFVRDLMDSRHYLDMNKPDCIKYLQNKKIEEPKRIPYKIIISRKYLGKFELCILPNKSVKTHYISIITEGFRLERVIHLTVEKMIEWFKREFSSRAQQRQQPQKHHHHHHQQQQQQQQMSHNNRRGYNYNNNNTSRTNQNNYQNNYHQNIPINQNFSQSRQWSQTIPNNTNHSSRNLQNTGYKPQFRNQNFRNHNQSSHQKK
ncbi:transcription elongation factor spt6 [Anaeramoeba flamelloides]|uniref:Transcription elongation factor spt6 n=1 Tax=Anaeramoeba flamelloides TaxID=1746091 RepID=A0ABQ8YXL9_9EUKA|nr:transcription elongation factor spt6 [Anaeramoeba flamelloides]